MPKRAAKKRREANPLAGKSAVIIGERNGFCIRIDDVPAREAGNVMADVIEAFKQLAERYPDELTVDLTPVGGGFPISVFEGYGAESRRSRRAIGFAPPTSPTGTAGQ